MGLFGKSDERKIAEMNRDMQRETNALNYQIAKETNQANLDMYREQFADQLSLWNMKNKYDDPSAQVARLQQAGLNPALFYGQSGQSGSVSVPSVSPAVGATMVSPHMDDYVTAENQNILQSLSTLNDGLKSMQESFGMSIDNQYRAALRSSELANVVAQGRKILSSSDLDQASRDRVLAETKRAQFDLWFTQQAAQGNLENINATNKNIRANTDLQIEQARESQWNQFNSELGAILNIRKDSREERALTSAVAEAKARIVRMAKQNQLDDASIEVAKKEALNKLFEAYGKVLDNDQKESIADLFRDKFDADLQLQRENLFRLQHGSEESYTTPIGTITTRRSRGSKADVSTGSLYGIQEIPEREPGTVDWNEDNDIHWHDAPWQIYQKWKKSRKSR